MSHISQKTNYFVAGLLSGLVFSSILYALNTDFQKDLVSSVFQIEESPSAKSEKSEPNKYLESAQNMKSQSYANELNSSGPTGRSSEHILVKFKSNLGQERKLAILSERGSEEKGSIPQIDVKKVRIPGGKTPEEFVEEFKSNHGNEIEYVELDTYARPAYLPNDPLLSNQWYIQKVGISTAWDINAGEGITIAILDAGVNCLEPDLVGNCVPGWNVASNNSDTSAVNPHGTAVGSTVLSVGENNIGFVGAAFRAKLMPIRLTNDPSNMNVPCSNIAAGIIRAADMGAKIASNSYIVYGCSNVNDAALYMRNKGGIYIRSAGNDSSQTYSTNDPNFIIASATDANDVKTSWSNYGNEVDIAAPGQGISCIWGGYGSCWGTSFSTPIVAGVYALMFSVNPSLTPSQADNILFTTADDLGEPGWDMYYGHGRVNALRAVEKALATAGTRDTVAPSIPTNLIVGGVTTTSVNLSWNASLDDNTGVSGYNIMRNGVKIATATNINYADNGLSANNSYTYSVYAYDGAGNTSSASNSVSATTPDVAFTVNTSVSGKNTSRTSATVGWSASKPATAVIKYGTSSTNLSKSMSGGTTLGSSGSFPLTGLTNRTSYYYQVVVTDGSGKTATSSVSSFTTKR